jgi:hypothetical protein
MQVKGLECTTFGAYQASISNQTDPFRIIKPCKHLNINMIYDLQM